MSHIRYTSRSTNPTFEICSASSRKRGPDLNTVFSSTICTSLSASAKIIAAATRSKPSTTRKQNDFISAMRSASVNGVFVTSAVLWYQIIHSASPTLSTNPENFFKPLDSRYQTQVSFRITAPSTGNRNSLKQQRIHYKKNLTSVVIVRSCLAGIPCLNTKLVLLATAFSSERARMTISSGK